MSADELDSVCKQTNIRGLFLTPSCSNPTTIVMSEERKKDIAKVIKKHDLLLIEDDAEAFMTYGYVDGCGEPLYSMVPENTIYICSMSKSFCAGLRIAFMIAPPKSLEALELSIFNTNVKTSSLDAEIVTEAIMTGSAHKMCEKRIALAKQANRIYEEIFPDAPRSGHPNPYYRWHPISSTASPKAGDSRDIEKTLLARGVSVFPSSIYKTDSKAKDDHIRISLSSAGSMDKLKQGLTIVRDVLSEG